MRAFILFTAILFVGMAPLKSAFAVFVAARSCAVAVKKFPDCYLRPYSVMRDGYENLVTGQCQQSPIVGVSCDDSQR